MEFAFLGFGLAWDLSFLPSFLFPPFRIKYLSYACPTIVFRKHITCLVSQVYSWREILPQGKSYLKSHSFYMTQILFRWDFGL